MCVLSQVNITRLPNPFGDCLNASKGQDSLNVYQQIHRGVEYSALVRPAVFLSRLPVIESHNNVYNNAHRLPGCFAAGMGMDGKEQEGGGKGRGGKGRKMEGKGRGKDCSKTPRIRHCLR